MPDLLGFGTTIEIQLCGDWIDTYVGENRIKVTIPKNFEGSLAALFEAIHNDIEQAFSTKSRDYDGRPSIGFLTKLTKWRGDPNAG